jgi:hypothetical protein
MSNRVQRKKGLPRAYTAPGLDHKVASTTGAAWAIDLARADGQAPVRIRICRWR